MKPRRFFSSLLSVLLVTLAACAPSSSATYTREYNGPPETLAVLMSNRRTPLQQASYLYVFDEFINHRYVRTRFDVIDRDRTDALLSESEFGSSGLVNASTSPRLGKLLGARYLVFADLLQAKATLGGSSILGVTVKGYDVAINLSMRIVDTESGRVLGSGVGNYTGFVTTGIKVLGYGSNGTDQGDEFIVSALPTATRMALDSMLKSFNGER